MGIFDGIKSIFVIPNEDDFEEELNTQEETVQPKKVVSSEPVRKAESAPKIIGGGKSKTVSFNQSQMQVVLVKPERYEDVTSIADHMNDKKTVVLNLESADKDNARRIIDFLSGAAYANHGNIRKVSKGTFLIVPSGVDMMGEVLLDDFDDSKMYF